MSRGQAIGRLSISARETIPSNPKGHLLLKQNMSRPFLELPSKGGRLDAPSRSLEKLNSQLSLKIGHGF